MSQFLIWFIFLIVTPICPLASVLTLTSSNFKEILIKYETVFVNFYADWCQFSKRLAPVFEDAGIKADEELVNNSVALGKVDCEKQGELCLEHGISKYPTLRLFKFGERFKSEYRNQRSEKAIVEYLRAKSTADITVLPSEEAFATVNTDRSVLGIFPEFNLSDPTYFEFYKLSFLVPDCHFYTVQAKNSSPIRFSQKPRNRVETFNDTGHVDGSAALRAWMTDLCTPLVRELTFDNAEEITEPRLPLLVLFFHPNDRGIVDRFTTFIEQNVYYLRSKFMLLFANGETFSHPLLHLAKTVNDLPVIAIDSFEHLLMYSGSVEDALNDPQHLLRFVEDFFSGKLHRQFHGQPEPETPNVAEESHMNPTAAPATSVFKLLAPSSNRYSLLRDEL